MRQKEIFLAFLRVGLLGYGGGPSSIPLVHKEVVQKYKWMNSDEFSDILALGNALPGPVATKMAGYIGYRVGGVLGMFNALIASVVPTIILLIILLTNLQTYKDEPWVKGMAEAVVPVVAVMLAVLTWGFVKKSGKSVLGWRWSAVLILGSFILLEVLHLHPAILIFVLLAGSLLKKNSNEGEKKKEQKNL
ncbi:chromate transporter [Mesobacillus maritimus]|uniref:Chromate transporter n=1 Tax=Mesobacillus maritimus TaxID=1643336 RepID=A0ABS7K3T0_9BACI|nr:chromate transporter [Mesobacillus maritimus]MBY0096911.1 chromate transporter [Mesobacillus maritimus]